MFNKLKKTRLKRTMFNLSHEKKMSLNMGKLYPCLTQEVVPGDTWNIQSQVLGRVAPLIAPLMHRVDTTIHYFFVPNRIIWSNWEDFITGNEELSVPTFTESTDTILTKGKLADYFGLPTHSDISGSGIEISKLPFYAYNTIWNEYYRDQDLQSEESLNNINVLKRAWDKDYFSSARPWAQKGDAPSLPIISTVDYKDVSEVYNTEALPSPHTGKVDAWNSYLKSGETSEDDDLQLRNIESISSGLSINDIRVTAAIQQFLEKKARGGSRYAEWLLSIFNVRSSDSRLNRPEYLGGGRQPLTISEVLNTSDTANAPQGTMAGHGISVGQTNNVNRFFNEHGWIMGILSVTPKPAYQDGIHRQFTKTDIYDYYIPQMAHLGEQEIKQKELFYDPTSDEANEGTFGYQSRYAEYKYASDQVSGDFRDNLSHWTLARQFAAAAQAPALNSEFVECTPDADRILAAGDSEDYLWYQIYHKIKAIRPMPYFGTPGLSKI